MTPSKLIVQPHVGVGPVLIGMTPAQVANVLDSKPVRYRKGRDDRHETEAYDLVGMHVFYDGISPIVEYIEVHKTSEVDVLYKNLFVFDVPASDVVARIAADSPYDSADPELGYSYIFPALDLSLWRPVVPEDDDDPEGRYFSTIGIGTRGYYSRS